MLADKPLWRIHVLLQRNTALSPSRLKMDSSVKQWLKQRQDLLVLYGQLCETNCLEPTNLELFCQTLVDYLSAGHFTVFEKVAERCECYKEVGIDTVMLEKITSTTDFALNFNDKYTEPDDFEHLLQDLSVLGEHLAHRMDWEDQILKPYLELFSKLH